MHQIFKPLLLLGISAAAAAQSGTYSNITQYPVPTANSAPTGIAAGADGALWFTESSGNNIGRITTAGAITEYPIPTANSGPNGITAGPDRALWFTETNGNKIGRISVEGAIREFRIPTPKSSPVGITTGSDGALWFAESSSNKIGRMTAAGEFTEYDVPGFYFNAPYQITPGPDGALWFTENQTDGNSIGRIDTSGQMTVYGEPDVNAWPTGITAGPDGALWTTDYADCNAGIGRVTTGAVFSYYGAGVACPPIGITAGPDGALWFTGENWGCYPDCAHSTLGRITTAGLVTLFPVSTLTTSSIDFSANGIVAGPDGKLWFAEANGNEIESAPACALGLSASFTGNTLTTNFVVGIDRSAIWSIRAGTTVLQNKPTPAVTPPSAITLNWEFPNEGAVVVESALSTPEGTILCSEWTTVKTGS
jgi:virginiamycin B lyase